VARPKQHLEKDAGGQLVGNKFVHEDTERRSAGVEEGTGKKFKEFIRTRLSKERDTRVKSDLATHHVFERERGRR